MRRVLQWRPSRTQVRSALGVTLGWSSGQAEGQVNRLKLIKRTMFGRSKLDLLRQRVLYTGA